MTATRIADLCDLVRDPVNPRDAAHERYVGLEHVDGGALQVRRWSSASEVQSSKSRFRAGDVLYGKLRPNLSKAAVVEFDGVCSTELIVLRPRPGVPAALLAGVLQTRAFREFAISTITGAHHPRTSWAAVGIFEPTLPNRSLLADVGVTLAGVDDGLAAERRVVERGRELKQAIMQRLFTTNHPATQLGDCCEVQSGVTKGRRIEADEAIEVPYLRVANVQDGHIDLSEVKTIQLRRSELPRFTLRDGDVLMTEGGDLDKLGRGFIWRGQIPNCVHQNHVFAVRAHRDVLLPEFLAYLVQSPYGRAYFLSVAHKTTNLATINTTKLKAFPVPLPPLDQQREIVGVLDAIDRKIALHERKRATLQELFDTLLHDLMSGRLRVAPAAGAAA